MARVLLIVHRARPDAVGAARELATWLDAAGHEVLVPDDERLLDGLEEVGSPPPPDLSGIDLAVSLGGDGTVLRTVEMIAAASVPVLGVNLGQLGYLTEIEPPGLEVALERFFAGEHGIEERMLLEVTTTGHDGLACDGRVLALNEASIEKTLTGQTIRLDVSIGGRFFTPYEVDGLIVATPTGSTAHAFSARGPIVAPTHRLTLLTPVSPHMLFDRTLVLEPETEVAITVAGHRPAALAVDGRVLGELRPGDRVSCRAAPEHARLVTFGPRDFPQILKHKFQLSDR